MRTRDACMAFLSVVLGVFQNIVQNRAMSRKYVQERAC
ncbi:hypothetical protein BN2497_3037 [Janthinobacterium sp. CG23_2]|nr:hypothetical protein BN2497_3037 [Janthinobacterium sp. CG23_2]CUU27916.1 hypothetical protein BN3177_3037 [Janthinobacterium sp. CG23_2]